MLFLRGNRGSQKCIFHAYSKFLMTPPFSVLFASKASPSTCITHNRRQLGG